MATSDANPTNNALPLVFYKTDWAALLRRSPRHVDRLHRSGKLPDPLDLPGRPCWSRDAVLEWLSGGVPRRGRR